MRARGKICTDCCLVSKPDGVTSRHLTGSVHRDRAGAAVLRYFFRVSESKDTYNCSWNPSDGKRNMFHALWMYLCWHWCAWNIICFTFFKWNMNSRHDRIILTGKSIEPWKQNVNNINLKLKIAIHLSHLCRRWVRAFRGVDKQRRWLLRWRRGLHHDFHLK